MLLLSLISAALSQYPPRAVITSVSNQILQQYDLRNVPNITVTTPRNNNGPNSCTNVPGSTCNWSCGHCLRPSDITTCPNGYVALTFDDGPSQYTNQLLQILSDYNVKATFFVVGYLVTRYPEISRRIVSEGHEIAVHSWSHTALSTMTTESIVGEFHYTIQAIHQITGVRPRYYRPPYGDHDDRVRSIANSMGLTNVMWTYDTGDHSWSDYTSRGQLYAPIGEFIASRPRGTIFLQHDTSVARVTVTTMMLESLLQRNLRPVTVSECIGYVPPVTTTTSSRAASTTIPAIPVQITALSSAVPSQTTETVDATISTSPIPSMESVSSASRTSVVSALLAAFFLW